MQGSVLDIVFGSRCQMKGLWGHCHTTRKISWRIMENDWRMAVLGQVWLWSLFRAGPQSPRSPKDTLLYIRFTWTQSTGEKMSDIMRKDNLRSLRSQNREIFTLNIRKPFTSGRFQAAIQETLRNLEAIHFSITFSIFNGSTVDRQISSSHRGNLAGSSWGDGVIPCSSCNTWCPNLR